jgi:hypothetical protein
LNFKYLGTSIRSRNEVKNPITYNALRKFVQKMWYIKSKYSTYTAFGYIVVKFMLHSQNSGVNLIIQFYF